MTLSWGAKQKRSLGSQTEETGDSGRQTEDGLFYGTGQKRDALKVPDRRLVVQDRRRTILGYRTEYRLSQVAAQKINCFRVLDRRQTISLYRIEHRPSHGTAQKMDHLVTQGRSMSEE